MKMKIKELAGIQMGYSFRSRLEVSEDGDIGVIQMKDLLDDNTIDCGDLSKIDMESMKPNHFVKRGDLVFRSRGHVTTPAILLEDPTKTVVAAPLLRIRVINQNIILPEYLNWYISQRDAQAFLTSRARGTFQKMISKKVLEELEVVVPSLEKQRLIVELAQLSACEQALIHRLAKKRKQYISALLAMLVKGE